MFAIIKTVQFLTEARARHSLKLSWFVPSKFKAFHGYENTVGSRYTCSLSWRNEQVFTLKQSCHMILAILSTVPILKISSPYNETPVSIYAMLAVLFFPSYSLIRLQPSFLKLLQFFSAFCLIIIPVQFFLLFATFFQFYFYLIVS